MKRRLFTLMFLFWSVAAFGQRILPGDLTYLGAFRLPDVTGEVTWEYSGTAMTYYPAGDPAGPADGFPGSLFIVGHDWYQSVAEISIPKPMISAGKNPNDLNTAAMLQPFGDIKADLFGELEMPTVGLTYLPDTTGTTPGQLYFCWGQHFQFHEPTHGVCGLDLSAPRSAGPFFFGNANNYTSCDYMFTFPADWARAHLDGQQLATGRFREGTWSGLGPALYAFAPFPAGSHPATRDTIRQITPLLLYGQDDPTLPELMVNDPIRMKSYKPADQWSGAAWISSGSKSAVIFAGTKALGNVWYGFGNGIVWPDEPPYPPVPPAPYDDRGWWCDSIRAQIIFYDPADLAAVAEGRLKPYEPQPYATLDINDALFDPGFDFPRYKRWSLGAACFDREHGHLFIIERRADEEKSLVHVWSVSSGPTSAQQNPTAAPGDFVLEPNFPNPFNPSTTIRYHLPRPCRVALTLYNLSGQKIRQLVDKNQSAGTYRIVWDGRDARGEKASSGIYVYLIQAGSFTQVRKMLLLK